MRRYEMPFFGKRISEELKGKSETEQAAINAAYFPQARLFWYFCVLLCRELFEGDHLLTPADAQLLGLVDDVAGGGPVESLRDFAIKVAEKKANQTTQTSNS